jgi:hypothetical protein
VFFVPFVVNVLRPSRRRYNLATIAEPFVAPVPAFG